MHVNAHRFRFERSRGSRAPVALACDEKTNKFETRREIPNFGGRPAAESWNTWWCFVAIENSTWQSCRGCPGPKAVAHALLPRFRAPSRGLPSASALGPRPTVRTPLPRGSGAADNGKTDTGAQSSRWRESVPMNLSLPALLRTLVDAPRTGWRTARR